MGWADAYIKALLEEKTVSFRPQGNSMLPLIKSGALVTCASTRGELGMSVGNHDIVLCEVNGKQYLHQIKLSKIENWIKLKALNPNEHDKLYLIANASGHENGWISDDFIYGKVISIEE